MTYTTRTSPRQSGWIKLWQMQSAGPLYPGAVIGLDVRAGNVPVRLAYTIPADRTGRFSWPLAFGNYINGISSDVQIGENQDGTIIPIGSMYRNWVWISRQDTVADLFIEFPEIFITDAARSFSNLEAARKAEVPEWQTVVDWIALLDASGRFSDIIYPAVPTDVTNVAPLELHLLRAYRIASYCQENPDDADIEDFVDGVINSLRYFMDTGYAARNWWYNEIAFPRSFAFTAAMLARAGRTVFMEDYAAFARKKTNLDKKGINGANLADFCNVQIAWSLAVWTTTRNPVYLTFALNASQVLSKTCAIVARPEEGFLADFSITAHNGRGVQLSSCAYGPELVGRVVENAALLAGAFAITGEALRVVEAFLLRGAAHTFFHGMTDFHPRGRGMSRNTVSGSIWRNAIDVCLENGASEPMLLVELKERITQGESENRSFRGSRGYWATDYLTHFGEKIGGWVKTCSTRTVGSESGNGENLRGYYMGWGSALVVSSREDYWDIQPVWNWQRVPGTTVEQDPAFSFPLIDWGNGSQGSHAFAGVVSNPETGINTMVLTRRNLSGVRKTVFAHRDTFYFVGSAIDSSRATHPVVTTVDQMKPGTDAVTIERRDGTTEVLVAPCEIRDATILAVNVGERKRYDFPDVHPCDAILISLQDQSGSWKDINNGYPDTPVVALVLSIGIEHTAVQKASYVYMIASKDAPSNRSAVCVSQAAHKVALGTDHIAVVAFETSDSFTLGSDIAIKPLQPCAFIAKAETGGVALTCADLTQTLTTMAFEVVFSGAVQRVSIALPSGEERGKSFTIRIERAPG